MPSIWGPTRERQFKHIAASCLESKKTKLGPCRTTKCKQRRTRDCRRMAGATVNKTRTQKCELLSSKWVRRDGFVELVQTHDGCTPRR